MPTVGSLFSGIGGLDLGLERAGWEVKWQVEIDEWCRKVLEKHWPDVSKYGDVRDVRGSDLEPVDLIAGGFPCQPVSVAGQRRAQADPRWLWPEFFRIVSEVRPRLVLVENVPGLLHRGMAGVIGDLSSCGYDTEWDCIPAAAVGAPHLRYRVFIIAYSVIERLRLEHRWGRGPSRQDALLASRNGQDGSMAYADRSRRSGRAGVFGPNGRPESQDGSDAYSDSESLVWSPITRKERNPWAVEPGVGRVAHGVPSRVDRLRGLGNAVVPQVAEWIGRRMLEVTKGPVT